MSDRPLYALLAQFDRPERLLEATIALRRQGFCNLDAFSPFPVEGLARALGFSENKVQVATLVGGVLGAVAGFAMQAAVSLDYPLWVGGRPLVAVPAFMLITFELMVLGAVLGGIGTMLVANRLPRLNHPLFEAEEFGVGDPDRFFLAIMADEGFDRDEAGKALAALHPAAIIELPEGPQ
ncbi:conserved hypothetical protein [Altererythrobacter sp. B11]|uniref:DUF3341 domain-containing protein n=1 Tax=Altererythrobacter sp. B11 TaxID=2060312 RepID=UPI000DC6FD9D|nr:DUF3341 domain-containing protein [Altererythrobacter sp. B11]BBC72772.1 conserved hypothetical protein [Altererythrobacter sp. B11]